ncbi:MAG: DUF4258 domain-containing protein [Bacteroidia bacterium]
MAIPNEKSDLIRRFKFYGFGFLLGLLALSFIYKGKGCKMPGSVKIDELNHQQLQYTQHGECRMKCRNISEGELKQVLKGGKINYDKSQVHDTPCPTYAVEGTTTTGKQLRIVIADCDTLSKVVTAIDLKQEVDTCDCK